MKKTAFAAVSALSLLAQTACFAQANRYDESVAYEFSRADAAVRPGLPRTPLIAVPVVDSAETALCSAILRSGGIPVSIPAGISDFPALRDAAASFDGFVLTKAMQELVAAQAALPDGKSGGEGLMLLKSMIDRNVPIMGSCPLLKSLNAGMRRLDESYADMDAFIRTAGIYKEAKLLMQRIFTVDSHNDQPCQYKRGASLGLRQRTQVSLPKMTEGYLDGAFVVSWIKQKELDRKSTAEAAWLCEHIIDQIHEDAAKYPEYCGIATTEAQAKALKVQGKKAIFIGVENGYGIGTDISRIKRYRDKGMTYMTLCHTGDNAICHTSSADSKAPGEGLTPFGREVVKELNECGVLIDLSHANEATFWDVIECSRAPFVCTHSGAKAVYSHNRNLTDRQLEALAGKGGVCQVYTVSNFMVRDGANGTIDNTMIDHLMHCIEVAGIDHVGIGTDFDGGSGSKGLNGFNDVVNITMRLIEKGLSPEDIEKIWSGNFFRVLNQVQSLAIK